MNLTLHFKAFDTAIMLHLHYVGKTPKLRWSLPHALPNNNKQYSRPLFMCFQKNALKNVLSKKMYNPSAMKYCAVSIGDDIANIGTGKRYAMRTF